MGNITQVTCRACENCEHYCSDCGKSFCIDHIHRHGCSAAKNALTGLRFATAEIISIRAELSRVEKRVQSAIVELELLQSHKPPTLPASRH